jgi:hypothetical protein
MAGALRVAALLPLGVQPADAIRDYEAEVLGMFGVDAT